MHCDREMVNSTKLLIFRALKQDENEAMFASKTYVNAIRTGKMPVYSMYFYFTYV